MNYDFTRLERCLDSFLELGIPGLDCVVYYQHKPVFRHMAGYADMEAKLPVTEDTLWYLYSVTKVFTCVAAMQLYEQGKFLMDEPLYFYLPEFETMRVKERDGSEHVAERPILIQDLFSMSAGFSYQVDTCNLLEGVRATGGKAPTREMMKYLAKDPLLFEPGTSWEYSLCHDVLGALIEVLSGMTLGEYMEKNIFSPLGMKDTTFHPNAQQMQRLAVPYRYDHEQRQSFRTELLKLTLGTEYESGGAGLISNAREVALFGDALIGGKILNRSTVDLMRSNRLNDEQLRIFRRGCEPGVRKSNDRAGYGYGYGVRTMIDKVQGGSNGSLGEFGWGGAMGAYFLMDPDRELVLYYAQHTFAPPTEYTRSRMRNVLYSCIE